MELFNHHKKLFSTAFALFLGLTMVVAIMPALNNQKNNAPLPGSKTPTADEIAGKQSYIANGCVACHTQQVRNVDMDKMWGERPGIAADYASNQRMDIWRNTATLMGTERTGPDLTNIGNRQPSDAWHLLHLYQPRATVKQSIMPAYPWLFTVKQTLDKNDIEVVVPAQYRKGINGKIVANKEALQLVAYLKTLKQIELPTGNPTPEFLYKKEQKAIIENNNAINDNLPNGKLLYANNCQSCHQENGEGLSGAFPALKGSKIVTGEDLELFVTIIMDGYDARPEFAVMPAVGKNNKLSAEEITAIINHEKSSWGNVAKTVDVKEVKAIMDFLNSNAKK